MDKFSINSLPSLPGLISPAFSPLAQSSVAFGQETQGKPDIISGVKSALNVVKPIIEAAGAPYEAVSYPVEQGAKKIFGQKSVIPGLIGFGAALALPGGEEKALTKLDELTNLAKESKTLEEFSSSLAKGQPSEYIAKLKTLTGETKLKGLNIREEIKNFFNKVTKETKGVTESELQSSKLESLPSLPGLPEKPNLFGPVPSKIGEGGSLPPSLPPNESNVNSVEKLTEAIKRAEKSRGSLERAYATERSKRVGAASAIFEQGEGQTGYFKALGKLKGELAPEKQAFRAIQLNEGDIKNLFNQAQSYPYHTFFEKLGTSTALQKLLTGKIPTESELSLVQNVFGKNLVDAILEKQSLGQKILGGIANIANIPRSIMASFDLSFGGRQGAFAAPKYRKEFWDSWKSQFNVFGSDKAYQASRQALITDPFFLKAKEAGVSFTDTGNLLGKREEKFMSNWAEKIPVAGRFITASGRAYTSFANKFRLDIFKSLAQDAATQGIKLSDNPEILKSIGQFVNTATGRGSLGQLERSAQILNGFFFSPRLMASRLNLLNPVMYVKQPPLVRQAALSSLLQFSGTIATVLSLAKLGGADVGLDPRSSDFLKIKVGSTRFDVAAGFQQYLRAAGQLISGQYISSTTGKQYTLGEGYKPLTRLDILTRIIESKESPVFSFVTNLLKGQDYAGKPISLGREIGQRLYPMVIGDLYDIAKTNPSLLPAGILGIFGIGVQTYSGQIKPGRSALPGFNSGRGSLPGLGGGLPNLPGL